LLLRIDGQTNRIVRLVEDMLDSSSVASGKLSLRLERLDLGSIVRQCFDQLANPMITLEAPEGVFVSGDAYRLEQVVLNLLQNAIKYGDLAGRVKAESRRDILEAPADDVGGRLADDVGEFRRQRAEFALGVGAPDEAQRRRRASPPSELRPRPRRLHLPEKGNLPRLKLHLPRRPCPINF